MATYTENLNLKKPNPEDFYNIADFNGNSDIIDNAVEGKASKLINGISGDLVEIDTNGDIKDSGVSLNELVLAEEFAEYIQQIGGFKKYTTAGEYSFKVPFGITNLTISLISGGGGGGSGFNEYGGGGGGRGAYVIDQVINVTPKETLTVIVGEGGTGGIGNETLINNSSINTAGESGGISCIKRGENVLVTANEGTKGGRGYRSFNSYGGGYGGSIDGTNGGYREVGKGGETELFKGYGNGGNGGYSLSSSDEEHNGYSGTNGAVVICFGDYHFTDINL